MKPLSETTIPKMVLMRVVFPLPLGPIKAIHSPLMQETDTLSSALSLPNLFETLFIMIIVVIVSSVDDHLLDLLE